MMGFTIDSKSLMIRPPGAKIAGARVLFDELQAKAYCKDMEVNAIQQIRERLWNFRTSNSTWGLLTGPIDSMLRYTDECAILVDFPESEVRLNFCDSMSFIFLVWGGWGNGDNSPW